MHSQAFADLSVEPSLPVTALAVNDEFAGDALPVPDRAEIALLPPVSGG